MSFPRSPSASSSPPPIRFPRRYLRSTTEPTLSAMPLTKSQSNSSEATPESRRESLRRLSSLSSLHLLNPFARRRSNNTTENSPSTVSLSSSVIAEVPKSHKDYPTTQLFGEYNNNDIGPVPPPPLPSSRWPERKSSYICIPDDPIGGMPRSRTFSNLPLPSRAKKSQQPLPQSKSHARLPSVSQPRAHSRIPSLQSKSHARIPSAHPVTRLPSPIISNRKYSASRLPILESRVNGERRRLPRSDTMPLLGNHNRETSFRHSTAFKENISISPIKPLSAMGLLDENCTYDSSFAPSSFDSNQDWFENEGAHLTRNLSSLQLSGLEGSSPEGDKSSPLYRSTNRRPGTPGQGEGMQRWQSQPVLTSVTNNRQSQAHGEIKQARLMSARQAPTPPLSKTPAAKQIFNSSSNLRLVSHASDHIREVSAKLSPTRLSLSGPDRSRGDSIGQRTPLNSRPAVKPEELILRAEPVAFWTGRFSALNDRYRTEEFTASLPTAMDVVRESSYTNLSHSSSSFDSPWPCKSSTNRTNTPQANTARMRRAVEALYALCGNDEARDSFSKWQAQLATALHNSELGRPVKGPGKMSGCQLEMKLKEDNAPSSAGSGARKVSLMDRILGRRTGSVFGIGVGA